MRTKLGLAVGLLLLAQAGTVLAADGMDVTLPAKIKGELALLGERHGFSFDIDAAGTLDISLKGKDGLQPEIELRDPTDTAVDAAPSRKGSKLTVDDLGVSAPGTWMLFVNDAGAGDGRYSLKVSFRRTDEFATEGDVSPTTTLELTFHAEAGDRAKISIKRRSGDVVPRLMSFTAPSAAAVDLGNAKVKEKSKKVSIKKLDLVESGDHTIVVRAEGEGTGTVSVQVELDVPENDRLKSDYTGDDVSGFRTVTANILADSPEDYRIVVYDLATRQRLDLPDPTLRTGADGEVAVRLPGAAALLGYLVAASFSPPADSQSVAVDGVSVFDEALPGDVSGEAGLLRLREGDGPPPAELNRGLFVNTSQHDNLFSTYELIRFCQERGIGEVFYRGEWPGQGNGTLPGSDGGSGIGAIGPHLSGAGALAAFASGMHAFGIRLFLVYDDESWFQTPGTPIARAEEIASYNLKADEAERIDGALLALDFGPDAATGPTLLDTLENFRGALQGAVALAGTYPDFESLVVTWNASARPLTEHALEAADGIVHFARRTELDGPSSIGAALLPILDRAEALGLLDAVWAVLDTTDRTLVGGAPEESFFGRPLSEVEEALIRTQDELILASGGGPAILDWEGLLALRP